MRVVFMTEIVDGNLRKILGLFFALSRFKQHVKPTTGTNNPVTSSVNANRAMTPSQSALKNVKAR